MTKSLDTDLIQLKWQHVRSMEALQSAERENVHLKELIENLKKEKEEASLKKENEGEAISNLKSMLRLCQDQNFRLKEDFKRLKLTVNQEQKVSIHQQELLKLSFQRVFSELKRSEDELLKSKQSQTSLMNQLADAVKSQNSQATQKSSQSNELQEAKAKISELMNQISGLKNDKEKMKTEQQQYKDRIEEYTTQLENISKKNETLTGEFAKYKKVSIEKDAEKTSQINSLQQFQVETQENYEKILNQLNHENGFLRSTIEDLEEQVRKLSLSLVGNKSHFAKYIEVKTENVSLQNKLETIMSSGNAVAPNNKPPLRQKVGVAGRLPSQSIISAKVKDDNPANVSSAESSSRSGSTEQSIQSAPLQQKAPAVPYASNFTSNHSIFNTGLSIVGNSNSNSSSDHRTGASHPTQSGEFSSRSSREVVVVPSAEADSNPRSGRQQSRVSDQDTSNNSGSSGGVGRKSMRVMRSSTDRMLEGGPPLPKANFADRLAI